ncbi:MAG TPA: group III truncated hemoglobin [Chitinophagales bacterium]|jgi:hemoglobin|nr:group III truncated hemoglobin [Chitinophagales bacterium]MBP6153273.1 group III truncated hemoglobin [Chitinophagales bacterium]HQV78467.1 group III truncated hemoglobin [Chitinophagales bacterium]HQW78847.1 group III truncated hemoglobin [Chitinophagales bacterium]HRB18946.1 group III truncated hemoglobin [Chitinophagales bacterium]
MESLQDLKDIKDVQLMVDTFYETIRKDDLLADIFNKVIQDKWPQHLEKMYRFWQTVLFDEHTYFGSPFVPHAKLPVEKQHFDRWVQLFNSTVDSLFVGARAERAKWQGERMATMFLYKINYYQENSSTPLL